MSFYYFEEQHKLTHYLMFVLLQKKKNFYTHRVFIKPERRILFVWKWLNTSLRIVNVKDVKRHLPLIVGFNNFFATPQNHIITNFKNQIYKLHLLRNL